MLVSPGRMAGLKNTSGFTPPPAVFSPLSLFANGETGAWYDPSDFSTMYLDGFGFEPVTAVETPVGLMLDKSQGSVMPNGTRRLNYTNNTQAFQAWVVSGLAVTDNAVTAPDGTMTASSVFLDSGFGGHVIYMDAVATVGPTAVVSFYAKANTSPYFTVSSHDGSMTSWCAAAFDLSNGTAQPAQYSGALSGTSSITSAGNGWYRCSITVTGVDTNVVQAKCGMLDTATPTFGNWGDYAYAGDDPTSGIYVWGADMRKTADVAVSPTYQPITSSWQATIPGNHLSQLSDGSRPSLSARFNYLSSSENVANEGYWIPYSLAPTQPGVMAPDGTTTATLLTEQDTGGAVEHYVFQGVANPSFCQTYTAKVYVKANTGPHNFGMALTDGTTGGYGAAFNPTTGAYVGVIEIGSTSGWSLIDYATEDAGNGWYRVSITVGTNGASRTDFVMYAVDGTNTTFTGDPANSMYVWGTDVRAASDFAMLPTYQRTVSLSEYTTTGFPPYLAFNASNLLQSSSINWGTQQATVFTGLTKLGPSLGIPVEGYSGVITGGAAFDLQLESEFGAYTSSIADFVDNFSYGGGTATGFNPPSTNVVTNLFDTSGATDADKMKLRVDGVAQTLTYTSEGTIGSPVFSDRPLTIGGRDTFEFLFAGRIFAVIARGATTSGTDLSDAEAWVNAKAKAY